jgi:hypothetical protein
MKYRLFSDPGHSWLEVDFNELVKLGINKKITAWSYYKGNNVYLEEDVDAPLYLQTKKDLTDKGLGRRRQAAASKSLCGNDLRRFRNTLEISRF